MNAKNKYLKVEAMRRGACKEWSEGWTDSYTDEQLLDRVPQILDFCIKHNFPSNDFIRDNFDATLLRSKGIFVDEADAVGGGSGTFVVQGESFATLRFGGFDAATVWVRHGSEVSVQAVGNSFVVIHAMDDSYVRIEEGGMARVRVVRHGKNCNVIRF